MTSFERAGSPVGSGMFQFISNCVRSTVVSSLSPTRFAPKTIHFPSEENPDSHRRALAVIAYLRAQV